MKADSDSMSHPAQSVEVLVIGGGVIGSSIAYNVARQGRGVLVVDRSGVAVEPAASWASAGGIRRQEQDSAEAALAIEAIARWPALAAELDADLRYRQGGHLLLAESDAEAQELQTHVQRQHELGFADIHFMDRRDVFALVPGLGAQVVTGSFSPADGQADPVRATRAFAGAAKRHGAIYWTDTECLALERTGDRILGALTARGVVHAEQTVLAAGAWSGELASSASIQLPLRMRVLQALLSTPAPTGLLQPVINPLGRALSLKQLSGGEFLVGGGWQGDLGPDGRSYTLRPLGQQGNWAVACEVFPQVGQQRIARAWGGMQAHTPDDIPYVGSFSSVEGLTLALGSWHGFGLAPAIGRAVDDHLAGLPTPELQHLSPDRIAQFDPAQVASFLTAPATSDAI